MDYDIVIVGGGIAGSCVALGARRAGFDVLVLESELVFRDRIRGEGLHAWGVREARRLGIAELLYGSCARPLPLWDTYVGGQRVERRDLPTTTAAGCESMAFFHPRMQEVLLAAAERAGARVRRGTRVTAIEPGARPAVSVQSHGAAVERVPARLIVVAAGRGSALRTALGLEVARAEGGMKTTGVLLEGAETAEDAAALYFPPTFGMASPLFPLPERRVRLYFTCNPRIEECSFAGNESGPKLLERCRQMGVPAALLGGARVAGPLATFDGTPTWIRGRWPEGTALVGDAAGSLDPALGAGLSLSLLDARTMTERLAAGGDLAQAARHFQEERAEYYGRLLRLESWVGRILYGSCGNGDPRPNPSLFPRLRELGLDVVGGGPDCRVDAAAEHALFGLG